MLAPPLAALQIASSARLSESSFPTGARKLARAIRVVFKVAMFPLWLGENAQDQPVGAVDLPCEKPATPTRCALHWYACHAV